MWCGFILRLNTTTSQDAVSNVWACLFCREKYAVGYRQRKGIGSWVSTWVWVWILQVLSICTSPCVSANCINLWVCVNLWVSILWGLFLRESTCLCELSYESTGLYVSCSTTAPQQQGTVILAPIVASRRFASEWCLPSDWPPSMMQIQLVAEFPLNSHPQSALLSTNRQKNNRHQLPFRVHFTRNHTVRCLNTTNAYLEDKPNLGERSRPQGWELLEISSVCQSVRPSNDFDFAFSPWASLLHWPWFTSRQAFRVHKWFVRNS